MCGTPRAASPLVISVHLRHPAVRQTAEGHQHVKKHFWAPARSSGRRFGRTQEDCWRGGASNWCWIGPSGRPHCVHQLTFPPVSQWHALDGSALDDTDAKRHQMVGCAPLPSDPDSRLLAGFRNHIVVLSSRFAPQDNFSEFQVLFPDLFTIESLSSRFAVRTPQVLGQDISNELDQPT